MKITRFKGWLLAAILAITPMTAAFAQFVPCDDPATGYSVAQTLLEKFGEMPVAVGTTPDGGTVMFWANPETKTWSATVTSPSPDGSRGITCVKAAGSDFFMSVLPPPTPPGTLN